MNAILKIDLVLPFVGTIKAGTRLKVDFEQLIAFADDTHFEIELKDIEYLH